ncbi:LLM class F420-dependent oxidoreductase [Streptomyces sp. HNM0574]|uniref:LLM class F420-dependent oxidoreductase n=1 Tax=Streptomyces sp. HNM0574 TaxID=2714954 RepID=UPI00146F3864|nr:LLM class F420-dependent oxidoreductase [Streptomyces sp. HNM0574]NLU70681.1 LLM class F420-dependent oxidoreductase [Streptomyces sp. HNM0574]
MALRLGLGLPQMRQYELTRDVTAVARAAEHAGYDSVWVFERTLFPVHPRDGMYGVPGLAWGDFYRDCADPLVTLTLAAAVTERVRLGTSVLIAPLHHPYELARSLATLDAASGGRLVAGFGTGWSSDEYTAAGADFGTRGAALEETLDVCEAVWGPDPVAYEGRSVTVPPAYAGPKPHAGPPPVLLAGSAGRALDRVARRADGFLPAFVPHPVLAGRWARVRELAESYGRDPDRLTLVQRCAVRLTDKPVDGERALHEGSVEQIVEDLAQGVAAGVDEALLDFQSAARDAAELTDAARLLAPAVREAGL